MNNGVLWDSQIHNSGFTFNFTFSQVGTYTYFCNNHGAMMQGLVNVLPVPPTDTPTRTPTRTATP